MSYLSNVWYVAALATEVTTAPMRRVICDMPLALFRTESGRVAAVEDRCSHRQAPLSRGTVTGEEIQCNYHGFVFDCHGGCTHIPHQVTAPRNAGIRAYPLVERWGYVWLWWGEASAADPSQIPDLPWIEDDAWRTVYFYFHVKANQQLMADNLLDVSHVDFLHRDSIGARNGAKNQEDGGQVDIESRTDGDRVYYQRIARNVAQGAVGQKWVGNSDRVDRISKQMWEKPNTIHFESTYENAKNSITFRMEHLMTPETVGSTHYFLNWTRNWGLENRGYPTDDDVRREQTFVVQGDDIPMVEAQHANIIAFNSEFDVAAKQDMFIGNVHKKLQELYSREGLQFPPEVTRTVRRRTVSAS